jgi:DNA topoisomerase-1
VARKSAKSTAPSATSSDTKAKKSPARKAKAAAPRRKSTAAAESGNGAGGGHGRALVIVESPKKARSIHKFLGGAFVVKASMGHVRDLPKRRLGLDVANRYEPSYEIMPTKKDTVGELKREAARAEMVYLATDPDREGESIAWHLKEALGLAGDRVRRVTFHEITERAVREAFQHSGPINMDMVNAQQARRFLDRFVGYQLSPLLWSKVARHLSAGRVQSVAVRLIADREREIQAFVPEEY